MSDRAGVVTLRDGDWQDTFRRLDDAGGGVIRVPPGTHDCEPTRIDLAEYDSVGDDFAVRGAGLGTSELDFGVGPGDGLTIADSAGRDLF